ncbi:MAG TPA: sigma-70 family RNA polymerase sigma factor [Planctomycetota bacterium]|nr:sigma-70 family RNA polymerase sigma factor [Planctomycetota bacterium]
MRNVPQRGAETDRLTRGVARGDAEAITRFYEAWFERSVAIVRALTGRDESFALDVVQEALLRAIRTMRAIEREEELRKLIVSILRTTAIDFLRRELRRSKAEMRRVDVRRGTEATDKESAQELEERLRWLDARVAELSDDDRMLLLSRYGDDRTLREAGAALGLSPSATSRRLSALIAKLKRSARRVFGELA